MSKDKLKWFIILVLAIGSLIGYGFYNRNVILGKEIALEELELRVNDYVDRINPNLEVSDIFIYSDSDYYFSIEEKDTGRGAMELLVNPYTGRIRPEQGPNMVWNVKYGMHSGMMDRNYYNVDEFDIQITRSEALVKANDYAKTIVNSNYDVEDEGHEFYGYFTFHVEEQGKTVGMLSVNANTGEVWFHNWHGTLIDIKSSHD